MTTMRMMMTMALVLAFAGAGCEARRVSYDARASAEYQAAWQKKIGGDSEGYRAGLKEVAARYPATRAGVRAQEELRPQASGTGMLGFFAALAQLASTGLGTAPPLPPTPAP
jgi:hypothetical protein